MLSTVIDAVNADTSVWASGNPVWLVITTALGGVIGAVTQVVASRQSARNEHRVYIRPLYTKVYEVTSELRDDTQRFVAARDAGDIPEAEKQKAITIARLDMLTQLSHQCMVMASPLVSVRMTEMTSALQAVLRGDEDAQNQVYRAFARLIAAIRRSLGNPVGIRTNLGVWWFVARVKADDRVKRWRSSRTASVEADAPAPPSSAG